MPEDDSDDLGPDSGAPDAGPIPIGDSGWRAGDFTNGLGLLGLTAPDWNVSSAGWAQRNPNTQFDSSLLSNAAMTKTECLDLCSHLALPTKDFGVAFQRCMNQCQGKANYPEWEGAFN